VDGTCACDAGFEGTDCSTEERAKFVGVYTVTGTISCTQSGDFIINPSTLTISNSSSSTSNIVIDFGGLTVIASISGTSLTVASQSIGSFTYTGSGSINGNNITLTFNEFNSTVNESCVYNMSGPKQ
jgi:hypothetical protein